MFTFHWTESNWVLPLFIHFEKFQIFWNYLFQNFKKIWIHFCLYSHVQEISHFCHACWGHYISNFCLRKQSLEFKHWFNIFNVFCMFFQHNFNMKESSCHYFIPYIQGCYLSWLIKQYIVQIVEAQSIFCRRSLIKETVMEEKPYSDTLWDTKPEP